MYLCAQVIETEKCFYAQIPPLKNRNRIVPSPLRTQRRIQQVQAMMTIRTNLPPHLSERLGAVEEPAAKFYILPGRSIRRG